LFITKIWYKVELGFSARDIGTVAVGNSGNVILDGVLKPTKNWTIGQTKLPGNNQRCFFRIFRVY
jgi:hypothetical protein